MRILAIETSCDDTAISIVEVKGSAKKPVFKVLAHNISSQTKIHEKWGGVVPSLAKREHGKNLVPLLIKSLKDADLFEVQLRTIRGSKSSSKSDSCPPTGRVKLLEVPTSKLHKKIEEILDREPELREQFLQTIPTLKIPKIDTIAVTKGPGLEPALWVGINFAKALAKVWDKPLYPINHLEGHILASLATPQTPVKSFHDHGAKISFPAISLIVSGGHTELVLSKDWLKYKIVGRTRDDAVGEAFDKVARILGLPYPGGPEISKLALEVKPPSENQLGGLTSKSSATIKLPRPMLHSGDLEFSFSGIKTAVLYLVQRLQKENKFTDKVKAEIAHDFQNAVIEVIIAKTLSATKKYKAKTIIAGGGVIANANLREALKKEAQNEDLNLLIPELSYSTDNATMIALAAGFRLLAGKHKVSHSFKAEGNLNLK
ncbi:MAG TPA: tRNA (adenosine(37)-N6)-threonylcarbamoyltransferase complex transferase subunit TsaD [Candidatus Paceibacterota bacterium]|nr:tRNA (adenosine(37)-N6)-threonylcarbamoyltransferase complex transferase subunit TsaD [Candidatus Paceibacterota bacterium]